MDYLHILATNVDTNEKIVVPLTNIDGFCLSNAINFSFSRNKVYNVFDENIARFFKAKLHKIFGKIYSIITKIKTRKYNKIRVRLNR